MTHEELTDFKNLRKHLDKIPVINCKHCGAKLEYKNSTEYSLQYLFCISCYMVACWVSCR